MRFLLTLAVWTVTAAVVLTFFVFRNTPSGGHDGALKIAPDRDISIEITTTFSTEKDPFALNISDEKQKAFTVALDGKAVYEADTGIEKGEPLILKAVNISDGQHEVMVTSAPVSGSGDNAVRIRAVLDGIVLSDSTDWFTDGQEIVSVIRFDTGNTDGK
ncbi:MAG: hypothetical protein AB7E96_12925 [Deferribacterales bacterium]